MPAQIAHCIVGTNTSLQFVRGRAIIQSVCLLGSRISGQKLVSLTVQKLCMHAKNLRLSDVK